MSTWLKVCGISSIAEVQIAVEEGASALGFVSAMPSGSCIISDGLIAELAALVPPPISRFLLTSRTDPDDVVDQVIRCPIDTVQLVDAVPLTTYAALRRSAPHVRVVQVIHVEGPE